MQEVQVEATPRSDIKERLRAQVAEHLAINRPVGDDPDLTLTMQRQDKLDAAGQQHMTAQWTDLGFATRLVTVPSDAWQFGQDRSGEKYQPYRNGTQYHVAGEAGAARAAIDLPGIDLAQGVYIIPQRLKAEKLNLTSWGGKKSHGSVGDSDVAEVCTTYIDIDAHKTVDGMASEEEVWETFDVAADLYVDIVSQLGSERGLAFMMSGSGFQIWLHHEGQDPVWARKFRVQLLHSLAQLYSRGYPARIDTSVSNPARLAPLAGSTKRKAKREGRPHRMVGYWSVDPGHRVPWAQVEALVDHYGRLAPVPASLLQTRTTIARGDTDSIFRAANAVPIADVYQMLGRMEDGNPRCPGCGWVNPKAVMFHAEKNCLHDHHTPHDEGPHRWTVLDTVMHDLQVDAAKAYDWLAERFGLPVRETYVEFVPGDDEGMVVDTGDDLVDVLAQVEDFEPVTKPLIRLGADTDRVVREMIAALAKHPDVYSLGTRLVIIRNGQPQELQERVLQVEILAQAADYEIWHEPSKSWRAAKVNKDYAECIARRGYWPGVRAITSVTDVPMFLSDGSILQKPGWDPTSGVVYIPGTCQVGAVSDNPTQDEIDAAQEKLDEITCDYPIDTQGRGVFNSGILSGVGRGAIDGPCPLLLFNGNCPGVGKELAIDCMSTVICGRPAHSSSYVGGKDEQRKQITSILLSPNPVENINNIPTGGILGGATWDSLLASKYWGDRKLGKTQTLNLPNTPIWTASGSGVEVVGDTDRRVLVVKLISDETNPEKRTNFKHPHLLQWVKANRGALVHAALTLLRAYHVAGRPSYGVTMGSYSSWAELVGNCIAWLGYGDITATRQQQSEGTGGASDIVELFRAWADAFGDKFVTAARVRTEMAAVTDYLEAPLRDALMALVEDGRVGKDYKGVPSTKSLGRLLTGAANRVVVVGETKVRLVREEDKHTKTHGYALRALETPQRGLDSAQTPQTKANDIKDSRDVAGFAGFSPQNPTYGDQNKEVNAVAVPGGVNRIAGDLALETPQTPQNLPSHGNDEDKSAGFAQNLNPQQTPQKSNPANRTVIGWVHSVARKGDAYVHTIETAGGKVETRRGSSTPLPIEVEDGGTWTEGCPVVCTYVGDRLTAITEYLGTAPAEATVH